MSANTEPRRGAEGSSPYSTGGGGTVLEHSYGALLLSHLLTAEPLPELGDDVTPNEIAFQASSFSAVDDLVLSGFSSIGTKRRVSIGVRRDPKFVPSDRASRDLISSYVRVVHDHPEEVANGDWRLALVVASPNSHVRQLRELAGIARDTKSNEQFRNEVTRSGRTTQSVRERLQHFDRVIVLAISSTVINTNRVPPQEWTWRVLRVLRLREVRLEGVDQTDRTAAVGRLMSVVQPGTAAVADQLLSRLYELVGRYAPAAATKTVDSLTQDLNGFPLSDRPRQESAPDNQDLMRERRPMVRSDYLSQVRRIAPRRLLGREKELEELAHFCASPESDSYIWWRAEAWAGKSALLATFVLSPPSGVRVLSFFITARLAGNADRTAFGEVTLEQVLELLGEPLPTLLTDATREAHLLGAFERASEACRRRGEILVLVVDGLDEDQGVSSALDTYSIAAMLPRNPPAGMRIVVAGRPNPRIPEDVPDDHPLRWPSITRPLVASPHAEVVRSDAQRELKRLLKASPVEKDLLGLLTASGGGLSEADLAELTGLTEWEIEDHLGTVSARTFSPRAGRWRQQIAVYVLCHEEIQQQAARFLGQDQLAMYRDRIHSWVDRYRANKWPAETPEYALRGYFKLLQTEVDIIQMLSCATDPNRHLRMLDITGGDSVALAEIVATQESISNQSVPDLVALSRLSVHRIRLIQRNNHIPTHLAVVWAQLDRFDRAEATARSIPVSEKQVKALASLARHMATVGDLRRAHILAEQAESLLARIVDMHTEAHGYANVARAFASAGDTRRARRLVVSAMDIARAQVDGVQRERALVSVARATAAAGEIERAVSLANSLTHWSEKAQALGAVANEASNSGDWKKGRGIARTITPRGDRAQALAVVARAAMTTGASHAATVIAEEAEDVAMAIKNPGRRAWILAAVAHEAANSDENARARKILREAKLSARQITHGATRDDALLAIARGMAQSGDSEPAVAFARKLTNRSRRAKALAVVASSIATNGDLHRAEMIATEAESIARSTSILYFSGSEVAMLVQAMVSIGDLDGAEVMARTISEIPRRNSTLTVIAEAIAVHGDMTRAEEIAASITDVPQRSKALILLVKAGFSRGETDVAERIANSIETPKVRIKAMALLRQNRGETGDANFERLKNNTSPHGHSFEDRPVDSHSSNTNRVELLDLKSPAELYRQATGLTDRACAAAVNGDMLGAWSAVEAIIVPVLKARALLSISTALVQAEDPQGALEYANIALNQTNSLSSALNRDQTIIEIAQHFVALKEFRHAERLIGSIVSPPLRQRGYGAIAQSVAGGGEFALAEQVARRVSDAPRRAKTLASIANIAAECGFIAESERVIHSIADPIVRARSLGELAQICAKIGDSERAEKLAATITDPGERAKTLAALALGIEIDRAAAVLAQALSLGHWGSCLPALVRIEPEAVRAVRDEFRLIHDQ
ncbi:tetratricopeptide repeat protein [Nocardia sp. NPDC058519]|uniref:tetratricopeptide repeat protein n=1 Tax=Nocardia sp. NPDC058519 TaxID=3346535 RepID=UPI003669A2B9